MGKGWREVRGLGGVEDEIEGEGRREGREREGFGRKEICEYAFFK